MLRTLKDASRFGAAMLVALARRPALITTAIRQAVTLTPKHWWKSAPRLPVPRRDYLEFRQVTAGGEAEGFPAVDDVVVWLEWCRSMRSLPGR